ncbi:MAG: hypothetical protein GY760_14065 [Deltaproteobacteria bacterium]|nr:hypothetical protein [Deltaproteobacteria bacterium]
MNISKIKILIIIAIIVGVNFGFLSSLGTSNGFISIGIVFTNIYFIHLFKTKKKIFKVLMVTLLVFITATLIILSNFTH